MSLDDICLDRGRSMGIQNQLPLTESTFFILLSLAPGPRHGYAILKDVQALSEGRIRLSTGTLYGAIRRLLDQEWITRVDDPLPNDTDRQRKVYTLTDLGRRILEAENDRLQQLASKAALRLAGGPP
jgi:DNA-binding PadR family transcriptional regulator